VKILDFGLARGSTHDVGLTQEGAIIGTPAYMAPEQSRGEAVDYRCDLFSLGCVLYRMLTGLPPFRGEDTISTLMAVATHQPLPPARLGFPQDLSDLMMSLLEKSPDKRPASAGAVAKALRAMEGMPQMREKGGEESVALEAESGRRRLLVMLAAGLIVLLALGVGLAVWLRS
jgi:serine/threonine protein kinase